MRRLLALLLLTAGAQAGEPGPPSGSPTFGSPTFGSPPFGSPTFGSPGRFTEAGGVAIYRAVCAGCHMPDGRGAVGAGAYPKLADDPALTSSDYAIGIVLHGHGAMPPFGRTLSDEQVAAVVGYVQQSFGHMAASPAAGDVAAAR